MVVDNTSYWRMHDDVPLVVAEVNPEALDAHHGIVANPNCSAMQMVVALAPIQRAVGHRADRRLHLPAGVRHRPAGDARSFATRRTPCSTTQSRRRPRSTRTGSRSTSLPQVETFKGGDDYTTEERKMMAETRKILGAGEDELRDLGDLRAGAGPLRGVGVGERADARAAVAARSAGSCSARCARGGGRRRARATGVYPLASDAAGRDEVLVGRIRRDPSHERCLNLWVVGDNLRKGAATNAVQVAELLARARPDPGRPPAPVLRG